MPLIKSSSLKVVQKIKKDQNRKVKIIDYAKLKESGNKLKNKMGIEKIKIVYFD